MRERKYKQLFALSDQSYLRHADLPVSWYSSVYTVSTTGGRGCVYKVRDKGITYCLGEIKKINVQFGYDTKKLPLYQHYILTDVGYDAIRKIALRENL